MWSHVAWWFFQVSNFRPLSKKWEGLKLGPTRFLCLSLVCTCFTLLDFSDFHDMLPSERIFGVLFWCHHLTSSRGVSVLDPSSKKGSGPKLTPLFLSSLGDSWRLEGILRFSSMRWGLVMFSCLSIVRFYPLYPLALLGLRPLVLFY